MINFAVVIMLDFKRTLNTFCTELCKVSPAKFAFKWLFVFNKDLTICAFRNQHRVVVVILVFRSMLKCKLLVCKGNSNDIYSLQSIKCTMSGDGDHL